MIKLLRGQWKSMTSSMVLLGVATVFTLLQPLLAGRVVDRAAAGAPILTLAIALVVMLVGQFLLDALAHFRLDRTGEKIVLQLRADFTNHVVRLPIGLLDRGRTGELLARGTSDAGLLRPMPRAVADVVFGAVTLLGAGILMLSIDPITVGVVIAVMAIAFVAGAPFLSRIQRASLDRQVALGDYTAGLDRALGAARTIKLFGAEDREVTVDWRSARTPPIGSGVRIALATATDIVDHPDGCHRLISGDHDHRWAPRRPRRPARRPVRQPVRLRHVRGLSRHRRHHRTQPSAHLGRRVSTPHHHAARTAGRRPASAHRRRRRQCGPGPKARTPRRWSNSSTCPSATARRAPVLDDVSFTLGRDQITALIGPSGSGKSTILALLCRFHDPRRRHGPLGRRRRSRHPAR